MQIIFIGKCLYKQFYCSLPDVSSVLTPLSRLVMPLKMAATGVAAKFGRGFQYTHILHLPSCLIFLNIGYGICIYLLKYRQRKTTLCLSKHKYLLTCSHTCDERLTNQASARHETSDFVRYVLKDEDKQLRLDYIRDD